MHSDRAKTNISRRNRSSAEKIQRRGCYIGWVGHGNLGDEAIVEVARKVFQGVNWTGQFNTFRNSLVTENGSSKYDVGILGGGTLINSPSSVALASYSHLSAHLGRPLYTFGVGVEDPSVFARARGRTDQRAQWADCLGALPVVGVRGPLSLALLEDVGMRNVKVVGDPAVWFYRESISPPDPDRPDGKYRIAINYGAPVGVPMWGSQAQVHGALANLIRCLHKLGHEVLLIAACPSDEQWCRALAKDSGLEGAFPYKLCNTTSDYFEYLEEVDCFVSFKLHPGILSMARNIPTILLEYSPKCRDFALSVGCEDFVIRTDQMYATRLYDLTLDLCLNKTWAMMKIARGMRVQRDAFCSYVDQVLAPNL